MVFSHLFLNLFPFLFCVFRPKIYNHFYQDDADYEAYEDCSCLVLGLTLPVLQCFESIYVFLPAKLFFSSALKPRDPFA